ncbi:hypothetical protein [Streptacidiphilus cavernicola]|uniref:PD-(D/E)XK endonuclease-like domain-containing protein n=1 Tax=Streptacidiphilus cavernicola TaxID=3342716 RepID=A0ABV6VYY3_9ACTN
MLDFSTLLTRAVPEAFRRASANDPHPPGLSLSGLGPCLRQAAFQAANTPYDPEHDDGGEKRSAWLGTAIHLWFLPILAEALSGYGEVVEVLVEDPITLTAASQQIPGRHDLYVRVRDTETGEEGGCIVDLKTVKEWALGKIVSYGPEEHQEWQVDGYALGRRQAGYPVTATAFIHMDRATGEDVITVRPFGQREAMAVIERVRLIYSHADQPLWAPTDLLGPDLDWRCRSCPFTRRCWPEITDGRSNHHAIDPAKRREIADAAAEYTAARTRETQAKADKQLAAAKLADAKSGSYKGPIGTFKIGRIPGKEIDDPEALSALLAEHDLTRPKKRSKESLTVTAITG